MGRRVTGHLYQRGKYYWLAYRLNGKTFQQSLEVTTEDEAKIERDKIITPLQAKKTADRLKNIKLIYDDAQVTAQEYDKMQAEKSRHRITIAETWQAFLNDKTRPQDTGDLQLEDYYRFWNRFEEWLKINRPDRQYLEEVTQQDAEDFLNWLEKESPVKLGRKAKKPKPQKPENPEESEDKAGKEEKTVKGVGANRYNKFLRGLKLIFKTLAPKCNNMENPFGKFKGKTPEIIHHRPLTEDELKKVCNSAEGELQTLFAIGLYCGFRISDACLLRWTDIDFNAGHIIRYPMKTKKRTNKPVFIPLHSALAHILQEVPKTEESEYVLPRMAERYLRDKGASVAKQIRKHFSACGIKTNEDTGKAKKTALVTFHSLRHTLISLMAQKGIPLATVRQIAGHRSEEVQRAYLHIDGGAAKSAIDTIPALIGDVVEAQAVDRTDKDRIADALAYIGKSRKIPDNIKKRLTNILTK